MTEIYIAGEPLAGYEKMMNSWKTILALVSALLLLTIPAFGQTALESAQVSGIVKDPAQAAVSGAQVVITEQRTQVKITAVTDSQGAYLFPSLQPGIYVVDVGSKGLRNSASPELKLSAGQTIQFDVVLQLATIGQSVNVTADAENAYRVENVAEGGPLGTTPILNTPYSVNVISRQLIDDTQSRNVKQAAKYLPLVSFQEMQGPEVIRPATRGMQGSNMQNARKDGMGIAVTTPSALEEYEQIEVVSGLGGQLYGPTNPSGVFNFVTKRPTEEQFREIELSYEGSKVGTVHADLGGRFGATRRFGYRLNGLLADGKGYVDDSQLRRQLFAGAADVRVTQRTRIEGNFSYYNLFQHGYPGWFAYSPTTQPLSTSGSKTILLPKNAPDPAALGFGQSFSGVDLKSKIGEFRLKHDFSSSWHLVAGALNQVSDRNINTAVNQFIDNIGNYKTYLANGFSALAPRFHVVSDSVYLSGKLNTGRISHDVVMGTTGYRFASYSAVTGPPKTALCTSNIPLGVCQANISAPLIFVPPVEGIFSYAKTSPSNGIFGSSIIRQQGISLGDTLSLSERWLVKVSASQDWTWTDSFTDNASTGFVRTRVPGYVNQSVSGSGSILFKPHANMTIYGTVASSIQAPDVAAANTGSIIIVNASQALPPYRSKEVEIGYKLVVRRINFSTAIFRIERPFATIVTGIADTVCGAQSGTSNCQEFEITGQQRNYGAEGMVSGRILESLMVMGGLSVLDPRLTDTGIAATNDKKFVGIPTYKSNIFVEYRLPMMHGVYLNSDWQHVGRRAMDDINSAYLPQYNLVDLGIRCTTRVWGKSTTWRVTANNLTNVHYWSTLGPGSITGQSTGSYLGHLGEPRLFTASTRINF
ncbi:MAG TPA: TonB-dependent receptor [Terriglobia bacterium]|nr:TonB-dependent receptor [Terriglobia bacterium]